MLVVIGASYHSHFSVVINLCQEILPVTVIPAATVRFPGPEAHPAEVGLAVLVLANHVVTAAIFLNGHVAFRTLLRVGGYPV